MTTAPFGTRLQAVFQTEGHLCVGIDPHPAMLAAWGLPDTAVGLERLARAVVAASSGRAGIVKPQIALFERHGAAGYAALERVLRDAQEAQLLVIADVKRGEIASSMAGYADAWLRPGSPLEADAITLNPYLGFGSLSATIDAAILAGKGVFVLAATSNPEAAALQSALLESSITVAADIARQAGERNVVSRGGLGSVGLVLGGTIHLADFGIDPHELIGTPVLAPGFGHQGAASSSLRATFGPLAAGTVVNQSRSLLSTGAPGIVSAIEREQDAIREALQ